MSPIDTDFSDRVLAALARDRGAVMALVNAALLALPGIRLVTWLAVSPDRTRTERIGTTDAAAFPIGGFDRVDDEDPWCIRILGQKQDVICNSVETLFDFLPDEAQALIDLGYGASASIPIVIGGSTIGTINVLGDGGALTQPIMAQVRALLPVAAQTFAFKEKADQSELNV